MARIEKSLVINAPVKACAKELLALDGYRRFVPNLAMLCPKGDAWHWEVLGPEGERIEWDVAIDTGQHENRGMAWHTTRNADISHSGTVRLEPLEENQKTRMNLVIVYDPNSIEPWLWEKDLRGYAEQRIDESLRVFKTLVEDQMVSVQVKTHAGKTTERVIAPDDLPFSI